MTRPALISLAVLLALLLAGAWYWTTHLEGRMTLGQALALAQEPGSECAQKGTLAGTGTYNANSKTWWLDWTPQAQNAQQGCNPACVVAASSTVEINWRCTGLVEPAASYDFSEEGTVVRNNPGMKSDVWYLVYEKPGAPALSVELDLNSVPAPYIDISQGEHVQVVGNLRGSVVTVHSIMPASSGSAGTLPITLYYYDPARDQGPGGAQCSTNGLVAVDRAIPATTTPLAASIRLLLTGQLTAAERAQGLMTEFPLPGVSLVSAALATGVATLTFSDPQGKTSGGSCRVAVLWAQIEATAKQFPSVTSVRFKPDTLFQP